MVRLAARLIGVRELRAGSLRVPVLLFRRDRGSIAAHLLLGKSDKPILDAATVQQALRLTSSVLPQVLLARGRRMT